MKWLHLADFHAGRYRELQRNAYNKLLNRAKQLRFIDAIFITGDISFSGKATEFTTFCEDFLNELKVIQKNSQIFIVPGNHDIDCSVGNYLSFEEIKCNWEFFLSGETGICKRQNNLKRMNAYNEFVDNNLNLSQSFITNSVLSFTQQTYYSQENYGVVLTNSNWFCDKDHDYYGKLAIGIDQIEDAILKLKDHVFIIFLLCHHPFEYLNNRFHSRYIKTFSENNVIFLHGHNHYTDNKAISIEKSKFFVISSTGASYCTSTGEAGAASIWRNSFVLGSYDSEYKIITLESENYSTETGKWIKFDQTQKYEQCILPRFPDLQIEKPNLDISNHLSTSDTNIPLRLSRRDILETGKNLITICLIFAHDQTIHKDFKPIPLENIIKFFKKKEYSQFKSIKDLDSWSKFNKKIEIYYNGKIDIYRGLIFPILSSKQIEDIRFCSASLLWGHKTFGTTTIIHEAQDLISSALTYKKDIKIICSTPDIEELLHRYQKKIVTVLTEVHNSYTNIFRYYELFSEQNYYMLIRTKENCNTYKFYLIKFFCRPRESFYVQFSGEIQVQRLEFDQYQKCIKYFDFMFQKSISFQSLINEINS